ncbi:PaaI family thioesterase [Streptomyces roseirectus]|uniref:PaaI family thioesterase n=1 Tax=Streptomyces roseirectus TaxID=2768066 RepID=A0A7H0I7H0_9ACTN|nr:PaaI family thioesterase [Streptomyces roseirectus]
MSLALDDLLAAMPFARRSGVELTEATPERAVGTLAWSPEACTVGGILHGGALMTLADAVGAVCAFLNLPEGAGTSTVESKTNFLRGVRSGTVTATSRPLHVGGRLIVVQDVRRAPADPWLSLDKSRATPGSGKAAVVTEKARPGEGRAFSCGALGKPCTCISPQEAGRLSLDHQRIVRGPELG